MHPYVGKLTLTRVSPELKRLIPGTAWLGADYHGVPALRRGAVLEPSLMTEGVDQHVQGNHLPNISRT